MFRWSWCSLAVLLVVGAVGCSGGAKPLPGSICEMNSDCNNPLSCSYGRCHVTCKEARDCAPGQLCAGPLGAGVCLLLDEQECSLNSDCPGELFCAIDLKCRTQCQNERDCTTRTQKCVPSLSDVNIKVCAEPPELEDEMLTPAPDAGAPADAGSPADAAPDAGDAPGSDAGADAAVESVPDAGDAGQSGDGGQSADGGDAGGTVIPEMEPNEDRNQATPYTPGTTVLGSIGSATDLDFYEVTVPADDLAGGYYQASITDVGTGRLTAIVYTASDNTVIHQTGTTTSGASLFVYWAAAPASGAAAPAPKYRIQVGPAGNFSAPYSYTFKIQYTRIDDAFEPNDDRDGAKPIPLGTPITAYFFSGFKMMQVSADEYQDWFAVDLAAGMTTVALDNRVTNWRAQFDMIDSLGNPLSAARVIGSAGGASIRHMFMVTTPGRYRASLQGYGNGSTGGEAGNAMTVPDNFTKPYTLTISQ